MRQVRVRYHFEEEGWWAESEDLPGWTAAGGSFNKVRQLAREGAAVFADDRVDVVEEGVPLFPQAGVWRTLSGTTQTTLIGIGGLVVDAKMALTAVPVMGSERTDGVAPGQLRTDSHDLLTAQKSG